MVVKAHAPLILHIVTCKDWVTHDRIDLSIVRTMYVHGFLNEGSAVFGSTGDRSLNINHCMCDASNDARPSTKKHQNMQSMVVPRMSSIHRQCVGYLPLANLLGRSLILAKNQARFVTVSGGPSHCLCEVETSHTEVFSRE